CPFCGTVADDEYVRAQGMAKTTGTQLMAIVCTYPNAKGKKYLSADDLPGCVPNGTTIQTRIQALCKQTGLTVPEEPIKPLRPSPWTRGASRVTRHGLLRWGDLFSPRQMFCLLSFVTAIRNAEVQIRERGYEEEKRRGVVTALAIAVDRIADRGSNLCHWDNAYTKTANTFGRQALPMVWDFAETNPFGDSSGDAAQAIEWVAGVIEAQTSSGLPALVSRGSAKSLPWPDASFDAVV